VHKLVNRNSPRLAHRFHAAGWSGFGESFGVVIWFFAIVEELANNFHLWNGLPAHDFLQAGRSFPDIFTD
jgi:hypothetical protein